MMIEEEDVATKAYALLTQHIKDISGNNIDWEENSFGGDFSYEDDFDDNGNVDEEHESIVRDNKESDNSIPFKNTNIHSLQEEHDPFTKHSGSTRFENYDLSNDKLKNNETFISFKNRILNPLSDTSHSDGNNFTQLEMSNEHEIKPSYSKEDKIYLSYYDILFTFLERKHLLSEQMKVSKLQQSIGDDVTMGDNDDSNLQQEDIDIDLQYLFSLSKQCHKIIQEYSPSLISTSYSLKSRLARATREMQLWQLLHILRKHEGNDYDRYEASGEEIDIGRNKFLLPDNVSDQTYSHNQSCDPSQIHLSPIEVLQTLYQSRTKFQRRILIFQWISLSLLSSNPNIDRNQINLPPQSRKTMWPYSLSLKNAEMDPDAPLRNRTKTGGASVQLPGTDESDEIDFLKALLHLYQSNQINEAIQLCHDVGQPWRASTFSGGLLLPLIQKNNRNLSNRTDDNDLHQIKWNANYFLWKEQCAKLAKQTFEFAAACQTKGPPAILYESALYSILSDDLESSLQNPILRTWEEGLYNYFHSLIYRTMDETLMNHCHAQRKIGKRYPFKDYLSTEKVEKELLDRTSNASMISEETIFDSLSSSKYDAIRNESLDTIRVLTSSFIIGKKATFKSIQDYVTDVVSIDNVAGNEDFLQSQDAVQYLPCILHIVLYLDKILQSSSSASLIHETMQALLLMYLKMYLYPNVSLWKCVSLYTSLLSDEDVQIEEYKTFLKTVRKPMVRKEMMEQARSCFRSGLDLIIVKLLLDDAYSPLTLEDIEEMSTSDHKMRMGMIQWLLFYPEHRFESIWYANIMLRQLLIQVNHSDGKFLSYAQEFVDDYFPRDSIRVAKDYYNDKLILSSMEAEEAAKFMKEIDLVLEEHEALRYFVDANTAYESWRMQLIRCKNEIKETISNKNNACSTRKKQMQMLNTVESDIAIKMQIREHTRKIKYAVNIIIAAAFEAEYLFDATLKYPGGWLTHFDTIDEEHKKEIHKLREVCIPHAISLWKTICIEMGELMESIEIELECMEMNHNEEDEKNFNPQYWYRKFLSVATLVAQDEYHIHQVLSNGDMKNHLQDFRKIALKMLKAGYTIGMDGVTDMTTLNEETVIPS